MIKVNVPKTKMLDFPAKSRMSNMIEEGCFSWIPAGASPASNFRIVALINYTKLTRKPFDKNKIVKLGESVWDATLQLPDREIRFLPVSEKFNADNYDEVIYMDPFDPRSPYNSQLDWALGSAHYAIDKYEFNWGRPADVKVLMDSGGAQLKMGTANYVDPHEVIHTMNLAANAGFALDVPPKVNIDLKNPLTLKTLAGLQKRNNQIFADNRREDLVLLNVMHGTTVDELKAWADIVHRDDFDGWALGIDDFNDPLSGVRGALVLYDMFKDQKDWWLHIFGMSGPKLIPAMAWLGKFHGRVSSDSSTWYEGARRAKYFSLDPTGVFENWRLSEAMHEIDVLAGLKGRGSATNTDLQWTIGGMLPCQCDICTMVKNVDGMIGHYYDATLITLHDLLIMKKFGHQWNSLASQLEFSDYLAVVKHLMGTKAADTVEYIHVGLTEGLAAAEARFTGGPRKSATAVKNSLVANGTGGTKMKLFAKKEEVLEDEPIVANELLDTTESEAIATELIHEDLDAVVDNTESDSNIGESLPATDIIINSDKLTGIDPKIIVGPIEGKPEPKWGWPLTQEVALMNGVKWACQETTKYMVFWQKEDQPILTMLPPVLAEGTVIPENTNIAFPPGSNMECLVNYVDINCPQDIKFLTDISTELYDWVKYILVNEPYYFRNKELCHHPEFKPKKGKRTNKELILHELYLGIRKAMDDGGRKGLDSIEPWLDNPLFKKRPATAQNRRTKTKSTV